MPYVHSNSISLIFFLVSFNACMKSEHLREREREREREKERDRGMDELYFEIGIDRISISSTINSYI